MLSGDLENLEVKDFLFVEGHNDSCSTKLKPHCLVAVVEIAKFCLKSYSQSFKFGPPPDDGLTIQMAFAVWIYGLTWRNNLGNNSHGGEGTFGTPGTWRGLTPEMQKWSIEIQDYKCKNTSTNKDIQIQVQKCKYKYQQNVQFFHISFLFLFWMFDCWERKNCWHQICTKTFQCKDQFTLGSKQCLCWIFLFSSLTTDSPGAEPYDSKQHQ